MAPAGIAPASKHRPGIGPELWGETRRLVERGPGTLTVSQEPNTQNAVLSGDGRKRPMLRSGERQSIDFAYSTSLASESGDPEPVERASRRSISDPLAGARGYNEPLFPSSLSRGLSNGQAGFLHPSPYDIIVHERGQRILNRHGLTGPRGVRGLVGACLVAQEAGKLDSEAAHEFTKGNGALEEVSDNLPTPGPDPDPASVTMILSILIFATASAVMRVISVSCCATMRLMAFSPLEALTSSLKPSAFPRSSAFWPAASPSRRACVA